MPSADDSSAKRPNGTSSSRDELAYYKAQYEQLESELSDFQASSRELESELERDIEASEKRERQLKEKVDALKYEVEEWKVCWHLKKTNGFGFEMLIQLSSTTDQMQTIEDGRKCSPKCLAERDHHATRLKPGTSTKIARYRGCER